MRAARNLAVTLAVTFAAFAQTTEPKPELLLFHPTGPPVSYEVATIKPIDPNTANSMVRMPPGMARSVSPLSMRRYIMNAFGAMYPAQIVGGPDWLEKDSYDIKVKVPDEIEAAQRTMAQQDRLNQNRTMQQSLLADRFRLKAHIESRMLPVYELVPAKAGLKITAVPAPPEYKPGDPLPRMGPGSPLPPGSSRTMFNSSGLRVLDASAIQMAILARVISTDAGDRPIVNHTGFTGYFDVTNLTWAPIGDAGATNAPDAPSLEAAIEKQLGLRLVPAKDPIEVLVIDSIDRPTPD